MREQRRIRTLALATVAALVLAAPAVYFGIVFATRDPVLHSLDRLPVPDWAARSPEDRVIGGSRWCFVDCRFRQRTLVSAEDTATTSGVYQSALRDAGWARWEVAGCPQVRVDGDYSCWTRDEYTLDLWVHPPECAYDPLNLRPELTPGSPSAGDPTGGPSPDGPTGDGAADGDDAAGDGSECGGSIVEIKVQNRVADDRGRGLGEEPIGPPGEGDGSVTPTASPGGGSPGADSGADR